MMFYIIPSFVKISSMVSELWSGHHDLRQTDTQNHIHRQTTMGKTICLPKREEGGVAGWGEERHNCLMFISILIL